jgi:hypothetical protein
LPLNARLKSPADGAHAEPARGDQEISNLSHHARLYGSAMRRKGANNYRNNFSGPLLVEVNPEKG